METTSKAVVGAAAGVIAEAGGDWARVVIAHARDAAVRTARVLRCIELDLTL
jgi:hypothetical protein